MANLIEADLSGAVLSEAVLSEAVLSEAVLSGAKNLTQDQLDAATLDEQTRLPAGLVWRRQSA